MQTLVPHWSHTIRLEATPISASEARAFVLHHLVDHRLPHLDDPVRLVVSELATNAAAHERAKFSVTVAAEDHSLVLTVRDDADPLPTRRDAQVMDLGGRGLQIVKIMSAAWSVNKNEAGSKAVWASFDIRWAGAASHLGRAEPRLSGAGHLRPNDASR